jgi:hypothetical protein
MRQVSHTVNSTATLRLARAVSHLHQAGTQLTAVINAAPSRYHQRQIRRLIVDLRTFSAPIESLASFLERAGDQ